MRNITRILKRQGLCVMAGVLLFAAIFGSYALATTSQPTKRAFGATADSMQELKRDPGNTQESDAEGVISSPDSDVTSSTPIEPTKPVADVTRPVEQPKQTAPVTTPKPTQITNPVGDVVGGVVGTVTDTLNCQYPLRPLVNGSCDNSDPCDPTTIKDPLLHGNCRN